MEKKARLYEAMYIINSALSVDDSKVALDGILKEIIDLGGEILKVHDMKKKRLAYKIKGRKEGYYYVVYFNIDPELITKLWENCHFNQDLLRFMILSAKEVVDQLEFKALKIS